MTAILGLDIRINATESIQSISPKRTNSTATDISAIISASSIELRVGQVPKAASLDPPICLVTKRLSVM